MKLTVAKLKQLILEQMGEFELSNLIAYLEELQHVFSSLPPDKQDSIIIDLRNENNIVARIEGLNYRSPLSDWFQTAIGSLVREIDLGPAQEPEWHFMTISRWYSVGELEMQGDIEPRLEIYRNGSKRFMITQFNTEEDELFNYYEGNDISTRALVAFMASDDISIEDFAMDHIKTHGETTLDSSTL